MGKMVFWEFYEVFTFTTQLLHFLKIEYMIVAMLTPRWATGIVLIYFVRVVKYVYLQCIDSHSAGDLVEDPFLSTRVCMEHGIETGKRRRSTKNTQKHQLIKSITVFTQLKNCKDHSSVVDFQVCQYK